MSKAFGESSEVLTARTRTIEAGEFVHQLQPES